ncbi:MAG: HAMP domain-containing histidine kinase, partial [Candidatus Latescibacteria bacterium]|nr:HAMP domain-containing histidine kinase [Candidatus Latescibacterota bacterium]
ALLTQTSSGFHEKVLQKRELHQALQSGHPQTVETTGADGREVLTRIAPIVRFDVVEGAALVGFSRERVLGEVTSLKRTVLGLGLGGLLVGMLMAVFLARGVIGPVERLKDAAVRIGAGEFGEMVEVETEDEIGALAETFNTMSLELRKREEEIRRSERLSAIGTTASVIAHEMKTPLTSVQAYVDMLMYRYDDPDFIGELTRTIDDQVTRLAKLIDDLLDYSRDTRLQLSDLDLNLHLHQAVNFFGDMLLGHKVVALENYSAQSPVKADPDKLEQVFFNLIKNGIEAQGEGGAIATLTIEDNGSVLAIVADVGKGVPDDVARNIFEPFFTTKSKGTGLGLAITQKIVEAHGGDISLYTPLDKIPSEWRERVRQTLGDYWPGMTQGACFVVRLPSYPEDEV